MLTLLRLPFRLLKLALLVGGVAYGVITFRNWEGELNVSEVVQTVQNGLRWLIEQVGRLN